MNDSLLYRRMQAAGKDSVNIKDRTARFSFASAFAADRFFGKEILSMDPSALDTSRLDAGAVPLLENHSPDQQIGKVISYEHRGDKIFGVAKLSRSDAGERALQDMADSVRTEFSFGYRTLSMQRTRRGENGAPDEFTVTRFLPVEVSLVGIPLDYSVGLGRADGGDVDLRDAEILDEAGKPLALTRSGDSANTNDPKERMLEEVRVQAIFEFGYLKPSGLTIDQLRAVDQFLKLPLGVRERVLSGRKPSE